MFASLAITGAALFGGGDAPSGYHAFAAINDSLSHGQVGDNFLSLNEAIQLHNNTLLWNQLSPAEQLQILLIPGTGTSTFLSWARLDASSTPVITIQQDLDVIVNTTYGLYLSSDNGSTVFDFSGPNITRGMLATTNSLQMRDITFSGGPYGIDVVQTDIAGQIGFAINNCRFENHTLFGVRISSVTPNGFGKAYLEGCVFDNAATGVVWDGIAPGRTSFFDLHDCRITGAVNGVEARFFNGGTARYTFKRLVIEASTTGINLLRQGNRSLLLIGEHLEARAPTAVSLAGTQAGATTLQLRMAHFWGSMASPVALILGTPGHDISGLVEDSTFDGDLVVETGGGTALLLIQNVRCSNGTIAFGTTPQQSLSFSDSRFDNGSVTTSGTGPVTFDNCCFVTTTLSGTATSQAICTDSYVPNPGTNVTINSPRPQAQLGSMHVLPDVPTIGSTITFEADLPAGMFGAFLLGFTDAYPNLLPQPLHVYSMIGSTLLVPGIVRFQQTFLWTIPNYPGYIGMDLVTAIAVLPDPGVSALPVQIAPGRRFALQ